MQSMRQLGDELAHGPPVARRRGVPGLGAHLAESAAELVGGGAKGVQRFHGRTVGELGDPRVREQDGLQRVLA